MTKKAQYVYVITKGDYSDYHICAVTMDYERAERMKKLYGGKYDDASIETYTLDEANTTGYVYYAEFKNDAPVAIHFDEYNGFGRCDNGPIVDSWWHPIRVYVRAKDEKHALKIAQDEYAKWKAEKAGIV